MKVINSNQKTTPLCEDELSSFFNEFNVTVSSVGTWRSAKETQATYTINDIEFIYYTKGGSVTTIQGKDYACQTHDLMILQPHGIYTSLNYGQKEFEYIYIHFEVNPIALQPKLIELLTKAGPVIQEDNKRFLQLFLSILQEASSNLAGANALINMLVKTICIDIIRSTTTTKTKIEAVSKHKDQFTLVNDVIDYINHHIKENLTVQQLADTFNISPNYLYKCFMKVMDKSPIQFMIDYRIALAKKYLCTNVFSLSQVSELCGFASQQHFTRSFTKSVGISPSSYRKNLQTMKKSR